MPLCSGPSAVWLTAQHPARQLFSLVRADTEARLRFYFSPERALSCEPPGPRNRGELTVRPVASLEGAGVWAGTLFLVLKKLGNSPLPIAASDGPAMCYLISYQFIALGAGKHKHSLSL